MDLRAVERVKQLSRWDGLTATALLGVCFFAGTLAGFLFSCLGGESGELRGYLLGCFRLAGSGRSPDVSLLAVVWEVLRWPLLVFLLSFTALGAVGIPVVLAARGFVLSYAAATFGRLFGLEGFAASLAAFGVTALLSVPVLFVAACDAFRCSLGRLSHEPRPVPLTDRLAVLGPCGVLLALTAALQWAVTPALLTAVCARLFAL